MFHPRIQCDRVPIYLKRESSLLRKEPTKEPSVRLEQTKANAEESTKVSTEVSTCKIESMLPWYISGGILLAILLFSLLESIGNAKRLRRIESNITALLKYHNIRLL